MTADASYNLRFDFPEPASLRGRPFIVETDTPTGRASEPPPPRH